MQIVQYFPQFGKYLTTDYSITNFLDVFSCLGNSFPSLDMLCSSEYKDLKAKNYGLEGVMGKILFDFCPKIWYTSAEL